MKFINSLEKVKILKRYKRFLADVERADGSIMTIHVANTGPMIGAWIKNGYCYVMEKVNKGKLSHGAELALSEDNTLVGINTQIPNRLIRDALIQKKFFKELYAYNTVIPEHTIGKSKIDFKLTEKGLPDCYIEVKNCSGKMGDNAFFPDTVSERAVKHLEELIDLKKKGFRSILIFVIQRSDVTGFVTGDQYHPEYGALLNIAVKEGVEVWPITCNVSLEEVTLDKRVELSRIDKETF